MRTCMKFNISSAELEKKLNVAAGIVPTKAVIAITEDFLLDLKGNTLHITATNLNETIHTSMEVIGDTDGTAAVPAKILLDTLKNLPEQPLTIQHDPETGVVEINSITGKYKLAGDNPEDFPKPPEDELTQQLTIDAAVLAEAIRLTHYAASADQYRPALNGILLHIDFNKLIFVATDAHRLVKYIASEIDSDNSEQIILPHKPMVYLKNILPEEGPVTISYSRNRVQFEFDNTVLSTLPINEQFPDYNMAIPQEAPKRMTVDRNALLSALKRISLYANKLTHLVVFNISDNSLTLHAQDMDYSNEATEQLGCQFNEPEPFRIGFNGKYLIEMLSTLQSDEVTFAMSSPIKPGLIYPAETDEPDDLLLLLMPLVQQ